MLTRTWGVQHVEAIEDAAQAALVTALETWSHHTLPDNPSAWVYRVAYNHLAGDLRQQSSRRKLLEQNKAQAHLPETSEPEVFLAGEVKDALLRMLFVCCDEAIPEESRLVFALKILCGFSVPEIAIRLFMSEANVYKRLSRARNKLKTQTSELAELSLSQCVSRLPAVNKVLYLLFTEGYFSSHTEQALRLELCREAIRLTTLLAESPVGNSPTTFALLALMHLHSARMKARQDSSGGLLLLEEQDRSLWDTTEIERGMNWLARSAQGEVYSRYHAEAGIAAEHCLAPSFQETHWGRVVSCYSALEKVAPSPIHRLNRAVAVAEWKGPRAGLQVLQDFEPPTWLAGSYLWAAVLADLHRRCGNTEEATRYKESALQLAPTTAMKELLLRRLESDT